MANFEIATFLKLFTMIKLVVPYLCRVTVLNANGGSAFPTIIGNLLLMIAFGRRLDVAATFVILSLFLCSKAHKFHMSQYPLNELLDRVTIDKHEPSQYVTRSCYSLV